MKLKQLIWLGLPWLSAGAMAQVAAEAELKESEAPPPAFDSRRLIEIDTPRYASLRFGVDPATLTISPDNIVRYVVVVTNATGTTSALYEGIRCATADVKTYARYNSGQWAPVTNAQWYPMRILASPHALAVARQGACNGHAAANSAEDVVKALKNPNRDTAQ